MIAKLCPHIIGTSADGANWLRAGARAVKLVDDFSLSAEAATLPHCPIIVGRTTENWFDPNALRENDPFSEASRYYNFLLPSIISNPHVTHWEGPNEPVIKESAVMTWYARFLNELARIIRIGSSKTAVIGQWSVGSPNYDAGIWTYYTDALRAVGEWGAVLARHSYGGTDKSSWPYLLLRHREDNKFFTDLGYPNLPVMLTESGADDTTPYGNPPGQAWKKLFGPDGGERYLNEILLPFDEAITNDPLVIAAFVYTNGREWLDHNIDGYVTQRLISMTVPPTPPPPPPPPPDRATYVVNVIRTPPIPTGTPALNVRLFPWGTLQPPLMRVLKQGDRVRVEGWYKAAGMRHGWACISRACNEWVSGQYLAGVA